jgi:hypothetical protein
VPPPPPAPAIASSAPVITRAISVAIVGGEVRATVAIGKGIEVTHDWHAYVLSGDTNTRLSNGDATIVSVSRTVVVVRTKLTLDDLTANPRIKLVPP